MLLFLWICIAFTFITIKVLITWYFESLGRDLWVVCLFIIISSTLWTLFYYLQIN